MKPCVQGIAVAIFAATFAIGDAHAQVLSGGTPPIQNNAAAGARSPGQMVTASFGRLEQVLVEPIRTWNGINEVEVPELGAVFQSQAALVLAQQFTIAIDLFVDALLARSGITTPPANPPPGDGGRPPGGRKVQREQR